MFTGSHIHYEMAEKTQGIGCGGIGAIHLLSQKIGLVDLLNQKVNVLKRHLPYHESDHVLNLAYNILVGGERMGDIELRRQDEGFLNGLGAQRIPDLRIPAVFGHRFRFDPDRIPADVGQRSGSCRTAFRRHPDSNPGRSGQCSGLIRTAFRGIRTVCRPPRVGRWKGSSIDPLGGGDAKR